jgi:hypothetical protein
MQQRWGDLEIWEQVLNEVGPLRLIIELGSGTGAFSNFLLLQALARGADFATFDRAPAPETTLAHRLDLQAHCWVGDLWSQAGDQVRQMLTTPEYHPLALFCDNGDKRREVLTFAPLLAAGDVLVVHDWGSEIGPDDMAPLRGRLVEMASGAMTRWWRIV